MSNFWGSVVAVVVTVLGVTAVAWMVDWPIRRLGRRYPWMSDLSRRCRRSFRFLAAASTTLVAMHAFAPHGGWMVAKHVAMILVIGGAAWFITALLFVLEDGALPRLRTDITDNRHVRSIRTQLIVLRRVTAVVVSVFAVGATLLTFREVRIVGTSLLASAGVAAAIAAFATNALLSNVVAGLQIAFSGALRLDDVVVVEGEWGRVEEITLTYAVVHIWDDRRLILPTSYFTTRPFENWTHTGSALLGEVLMDVDWAIDLDPLREDLMRSLAATPLWDGRVCVVQMVDAVGGNLTIRALVSALDAPTLWDLRCVAREVLANCVLEQRAAPRTRAEFEAPVAIHPHPSASATIRADGTDRVFSGTMRANARGDSFGGPDGSSTSPDETE